MDTQHETDPGGQEGVGQRVATLWSCSPEADLLTSSDPEDAVTDWLENEYSGDLADVPDKVTVYGFAPMLITHPCGYECNVLDDLLEVLDEEYGDQVDGEPTKQTEGMQKAAHIFVASVLKEYHVWACEQVCTEEVETNMKGRFA